MVQSGIFVWWLLPRKLGILVGLRAYPRVVVAIVTRLVGVRASPRVVAKLVGVRASPRIVVWLVELVG